MQKLKKSKGFTLTELAIVIAVIAILIAVLVPTFVSLINKAKLSSDSSNVYNFNTALSTNVDTPKDMNEVASILEENGYNMPVEPVTSGNKYVWDSVNNKIYMVDSDTLAVVYPENITAVNTEDWYDFKTRTVIANSATATYDSTTKTYTVSAVSGWSYVVEGINDGTISSSANITLASDLTFTSEYTYPINTYSGVFDGNNKTISSLTITGNTSFDNNYYCFIQKLTGGTIKNVTFEDVNIDIEDNSSYSVAALVGCIYDGSTISGVTVGSEDDESSVTGSCRVAGLVGVASYVNNNQSFTIENCTNYATITSLGGGGKNVYAQAGGLISQIYTSVQPIIKNCTNYGDVTCESLGNNGSSSTTLAGGIIANDASYKGEYTDCVNYGNIYSAGTAAGGIIGQNNNKTSTTISVTSCTNNGTITAYNAGGIVGISYCVTCTSCTNNGAINATVSISDSDNKEYHGAGGIVGMMFNSIHSSTTLSLTSCSNTAAVTSDAKNNEKDTSYSYAGGVIGMVWNGNITIDSCSGGTATITGAAASYTDSTVAKYINASDGDNDNGEGNVGRIAGTIDCSSSSVTLKISNAESGDTTQTIGSIYNGANAIKIESGTLVDGIGVKNYNSGNTLVFSSGASWQRETTETFSSETTYYKGKKDSTQYTTWTDPTASS